MRIRRERRRVVGFPSGSRRRDLAGESGVMLVTWTLGNASGLDTAAREARGRGVGYGS